MAIPSSQLSLVIKNTALTLVQSRPVIRTTYQIIADDALISEASFDTHIDRFDQFETKDAETFSRASSWFISVKEWHKAQTALDDYSLHDVSLSLKDWTFSKPGNLWAISHPVSGEFSGLKIPVSDGRPTLRGRFDAVLASVSPPSTWEWALSESPENLTVHCVEVPGADSYNVYADLRNGKYSLLGNVPDHNYRTISVPAGYYRVRCAPVVGGVVGVMGNENSVTIEAVNGGAAPESFSIIESPPVAPPQKSNRVSEWIKSWRKT